MSSGVGREVCPICGDSGLIPAAGPTEQDARLSESNRTGSNQDRTLSERDQTSYDRDRSRARETRGAADADSSERAERAVHDRTRSAGEHAQSDQADAGRVRTEAAARRLATAAHSDRPAELRDQLDDRRARRDQREPQDTGHAREEDLLFHAERDRAIAAMDRARAADDRAKAAADRGEAAREREEMFLAQAAARHDLLLVATDELTGAFTRKFGLENISREVERARRTDDTLILAFLDVDGLKQVNDKSGHGDGDRLLRRVVDTVRANVRAYDVIVRYGGDEFLCALPHLDGSVARNRMEKIAGELRVADAQHSITFGLAEYNNVGGTDELIARADSELLEAKRRRNCPG